FFASSLPPRLLHSFPTRRSSDLRSRVCFFSSASRGVARSVFSSSASDFSSACSSASNSRGFGTSNGSQGGGKRQPCEDTSSVVRSEEHTSELQSPYDLVCRLLLE